MKFIKPKFWNYKKPNLIAYFLLPFTIPIIINNFLLKFKSNKEKKIKSICVGNIYLGGTGKTPTTIKIYDILKELKFDVVTAKKFYLSQSDENFILEKKNNLIKGKKRIGILKKAIKQKKNIVIFDDGLQDKGISYDLEIVCFESENFIGNGCLLPAGPLREKITSLKKYDAVFFKSESKISNENLDLIKKCNSDIEIFQTYLEIKDLKKFDLKKKYLIFSGIGNPISFRNILIKNNFNISKEIVFPDHFNYEKKHIENIIEQAKIIGATILTTEKDFVKISKFGFKNIDFVEVMLNIKEENHFKNFLKEKINE